VGEGKQETDDLHPGCMYHANTGERIRSKTLQEITAWQIEKFKSTRKQAHKVASVNREIAVLKHFLNKAVEWGS